MFIIGIILGGAVVVFMLQNTEAVSVEFFSWQFDGSLALIVVLAVLVGMLISWMMALPDMLKLSSLQGHTRKLEKDLDLHKQKLSETEGKLSQAQEPVVIEKTVIVERE